MEQPSGSLTLLRGPRDEMCERGLLIPLRQPPFSHSHSPLLSSLSAPPHSGSGNTGAIRCCSH